jgi:hypothetical protein
VLVPLNGKCLEPTLPDVSAAAVVAMVSPDVAGEQPLHPAAEVAVLAGPQHEVKMVGHQAVAEDSHRHAFDPRFRFCHQVQKGGVVFGLAEDLLAAIAAIQDVIAIIAGRSPSGAWHGG